MEKGTVSASRATILAARTKTTELSTRSWLQEWTFISINYFVTANAMRTFSFSIFIADRRIFIGDVFIIFKRIQKLDINLCSLYTFFIRKNIKKKEKNTVYFVFSACFKQDLKKTVFYPSLILTLCLNFYLIIGDAQGDHCSALCSALRD